MQKFAGVTQTNPVLDGVTTVVTKIRDSSSMLSNESVTYEPAEKKQKTEDTLLPSSVTGNLFYYYFMNIHELYCVVIGRE